MNLITLLYSKSLSMEDFQLKPAQTALALLIEMIKKSISKSNQPIVVVGLKFKWTFQS